jgi:hypothetical protein
MMFTTRELDLLYSAVSDAYLKHKDAYERQKAKGKKDCGWHLPIMQELIDLRHKIFNAKENYTSDSYSEAASEINDFRKDSNWFQNVQWDKACINCQRETNGICRNIKCAKMHYDEQGKPIPADACIIKIMEV